MTPLAFGLLLSSHAVASPSVPPAPVLADDTKPSYRTHSSPACSDWRVGRAGGSEDGRLRSGIYRRWVLGYVTGFNVVGPDQSGNLLGTSSVGELYAAIDGYCGRNPSRFVDDAMRPIIAAIVRRRGVPALLGPTPEAKKRATVNATATCKDWAEERDNAILRLAHVVTLHGYVTAYNRWGPDPVGDAIGADDGPVTAAAIDKWCAERPGSMIFAAVGPLIDRVASERAAGRLPPGGVRPADRMQDGRPKP
jgi:hypothetical protein